MKAARQLFFAFCCVVTPIATTITARAQDTAARHFDFGLVAAPNFTAVQDQGFSAPRGFGWLESAGLLLRDRTAPDAVRRDFVWGKTLATFRIGGLKPGRYKLIVVSGDANFGDHKTRVSVAGAPAWPLLEAATNEFATLQATIECAQTCDITFDSPVDNWAVNALSLQPTNEILPAMVTRNLVKSSWNISANDPMEAPLAQFRQSAPPADNRSTQLARADYLKLIAGEIDFWKTQQNAQGAIIDPYKREEWQYSTPAYAHAAAALVAWSGRADLLESAALAMDWATASLGARKAANGHEDFYTPMLAHALRLLKPRVAANRAARWEAALQFDPLKIYRVAPGGSNWNVVSLAGEALLQKMGVRTQHLDYVELSLAAQIRHFDESNGLYLEGPMAYDHFPRLWLADLLAENYDGAYHQEMEETLRRAAVASLFMQSPWGELPAGGRSAQHQWNEAEQCVTYEVFAARALNAGDADLAGVYKRAAHLALASMRRWVRADGTMQIVKNWVDPAQGHAYEGYSAHSQYNLLAMSMLAIAYERAASTEQIAEKPAPADVGGFVLDVPALHKIFANASGTYLEIDTSADHHYDATGLIRVQMKTLAPQLSTSDSVLAKPTYRVPANSSQTQNTAIGVSWQDRAGDWRRLGELSSAQIKSVAVKTVKSMPQQVEFDVTYSGDLFGVAQIIEHYKLSAGRIELTTEIPNYTGPLRYVWPILADDGKSKSEIRVNDKTVSVSRQGEIMAQTFTARDAQGVRVEDELYPNHNGWARLGVAEFAADGKVQLVITAQEF